MRGRNRLVWREVGWVPHGMLHTIGRLETLCFPLPILRASACGIGAERRCAVLRNAGLLDWNQMSSSFDDEVARDSDSSEGIAWLHVKDQCSLQQNPCRDVWVPRVKG